MSKAKHTTLDGLHEPDVSDIWRIATVETMAEGFSPHIWLRREDRISVKPGQSLYDLKTDKMEEYGYKAANLRIRVWVG